MSYFGQPGVPLHLITAAYSASHLSCTLNVVSVLILNVATTITTATLTWATVVYTLCRIFFGMPCAALIQPGSSVQHINAWEVRQKSTADLVQTAHRGLQVAPTSLLARCLSACTSKCERKSRSVWGITKCWHTKSTPVARKITGNIAIVQNRSFCLFESLYLKRSNRQAAKF